MSLREFGRMIAEGIEQELAMVGARRGKTPPAVRLDDLTPDQLEQLEERVDRRIRPGIRKAVEGVVRSEVYQEIRQEFMTTEDQLDKDKDNLRKFAREVEVDARAHSEILTGMAEKAEATHRMYFWLQGLIIPLLPFVCVGGLWLHKVLMGAFGEADRPFAYVLPTLLCLATVIAASVKLRLAYMDKEEKPKELRTEANNFKKLSTAAKEIQMLDIGRSTTSDDLARKARELKDERENLESRTRVPITLLTPLREKVRISISTDVEDFEDRLEEAEEEMAKEMTKRA